MSSREVERVSYEEAILAAERAMTEVSIELFERMKARLVEYVPREMSAAERLHIVGAMIDASPELSDIAERLAILSRFNDEFGGHEVQAEPSPGPA